MGNLPRGIEEEVAAIADRDRHHHHHHNQYHQQQQEGQDIKLGFSSSSSTAPQSTSSTVATSGGGGGGWPSVFHNHHHHPFHSSNMASSTSSANNNINSSHQQQTQHNLGFQQPIQLQQQQHHQQHQQQQQQQQQLSFGGLMMMHPTQPPPPSSSSSMHHTHQSNSYIKEGGSYDLGELDQALFLYLDGQGAADNPSPAQDQRQNPGISLRPPTLNIFPSQPMHAVDPSSNTNKASSGGGGGAAIISQSNNTTGTKRASTSDHHLHPSMELSTTHKSDTPPSAPEPSKSLIKREGHHRRGPTSSSDQGGPKTPDPKTLRRLAQNREAARKSRLRKKAYVQQLESSRIRLSQLEQELQRARAQGIFFGGGVGGGGSGGGGGDQTLPVGVTNISSDAAVFDLEYARWLEEHHRITCELRAAVQERLPENELKIYVDNWLAHYDIIMNLKGMIAKMDVFHLVSGMWKTPAERCFMWMGGFRPSEIIKIVLQQIEPLSEPQLLGICQLQQSTQEAEEALSQGMDALNQSLSDTIASDALTCPPNMNNYMGQMAVAMSKLSTLEGFVRQADSLRQQMFHRLHQMLTVRQGAKCFLAIAEYFHRLRALSSLWLARPRQD